MTTCRRRSVTFFSPFSLRSKIQTIVILSKICSPFSHIHRLPPSPLFIARSFSFDIQKHSEENHCPTFVWNVQALKFKTGSISSVDYMQGTLFAFLVESNQVPQKESRVSRVRSTIRVKSNLLKTNYRVSNSLYKANFNKVATIHNNTI